MWRRLGKVAVVLVVLLAAAQLVRPGLTNPPIDPTHTIEGQLGMTSPLVSVLNRSCGDCHSNVTAWPRYTKIAPLSWIVASATSDGRKAVNFSEWTAYSPERRRALLVSSCQDAVAGTMPIAAYTRVRPETRLSPQDVEIICAASRETSPRAASEAHPVSPGAR